MHVDMSMLVVNILFLFCLSKNAESQYILHFLGHVPIFFELGISIWIACVVLLYITCVYHFS